MFLRWHMHSIVRDFKRVKRKYRQTKGNPLKSHAQQALNAIKKSSLPFDGRANDGNKVCKDFSKSRRYMTVSQFRRATQCATTGSDCHAPSHCVAARSSIRSQQAWFFTYKSPSPGLPRPSHTKRPAPHLKGRSGYPHPVPARSWLRRDRPCRPGRVAPSRHG